jgi:hypothetical protein
MEVGNGRQRWVIIDHYKGFLGLGGHEGDREHDRECPIVREDLGGLNPQLFPIYPILFVNSARGSAA